MNGFAHNTNNIPHRTELSGVLLESVEEVLREPIDEKDMAQAIDRARQVNQLAISNRSHLSRKLLAVMAIAAALLFVAILLLNRQSTAWAQVVEAVAKKPWLHSVCTLPDGKKAELWFSADRAVIVTQTDKMVDWSDLKQKSREFYNPSDNTILRVPDNEGQESKFFVENIFKSFLSSEAGRSIDAGRFKLIHQQQRDVNKDGKRWIEHHFKMHDEDNQYESEMPSSECIVYVDPDTQLPFRWDRIHHLKEVDKDVNPSKDDCIRYDIDYPETGPADIYALGVPKTAKVLDRLLDKTPADVEVSFRRCASRPVAVRQVLCTGCRGGR